MAPSGRACVEQVVDLVVEVREGAGDRVGPLLGRTTEQVVDVVVLDQERLVRRVGGLAGVLHPRDLGQRVLVHRRLEHLLGVGVVRGDVRHHVGDHQPLQPVRVCEGYSMASTPPTTCRRHHPIEPEPGAHLLDLVDEPRDLPERLVVGLVGEVRAELVVE